MLLHIQLSDVPIYAWILLSLITFLLIDFLYATARSFSLPPGPIHLPFIGSFLALSGKPWWVTFGELHSTYGDLFSFTVWTDDVVVINGFENIKRALVTEKSIFTGRVSSWSEGSLGKGAELTNWTPSDLHITDILDVTMDLKWNDTEAVSRKILSEVKCLLLELSSSSGEAVNLEPLLGKAVFNITTDEITTKQSDQLLHIVHDLFKTFTLRLAALNSSNHHCRWLKHLPGDPFGCTALHKAYSEVQAIIRHMITACQQRLLTDSNALPVSVMDHLLHQHAGQQQSADKIDQLILDVFFGSAASACTILWACLYLCENPILQQKIQREVDMVIGVGPPMLVHSVSMPFTQAFLTEVQRCSDVVPLSLPRSVRDDVEFLGYSIPKGTAVVANLSSVHQNEITYPDPGRFDPDRHLKDGAYVKPAKYLPYSADIHQCPGKNLSQFQMFLFVTSIMQMFDLHLAGAIGESCCGIIKYPGKFLVTATPRHCEQKTPDT